MKQLTGNEPPGRYKKPEAKIQRITSDYPQNPRMGDLLRVGDKIGYALRDKDDDFQTWAEFGLMELEGPVEAIGKTPISPGMKLYFKDTESPITNDKTNGIHCGYALGNVEVGKTEYIRFLKTAPDLAPW